MKLFIKYSGSSLIYMAVLLLIVPIRWLFAAAVAAFIHEICHYFSILVMGNDVFEILGFPGGMIMQTSPLSPMEEIICALAGPAGSLILLGCYPWIPRIALCAGIQAVFNLLPIYPLDGGRAFRALMCICCPAAADLICSCTEYLSCVILIVLSVYISISFHLGIGLILFSAMLLSRGLMEKFLANRRN